MGACVFATAPHSPPCGGLFVAAGSAAHAHGPLCASACNVIGSPAARMAFPPSRATRHPCPWRYRFGVVRLRGLCAPSAAETTASATQQGRPAGRPQVIAYSVVAVPATSPGGSPPCRRASPCRPAWPWPRSSAPVSPRRRRPTAGPRTSSGRGTKSGSTPSSIWPKVMGPSSSQW